MAVKFVIDSSSDMTAEQTEAMGVTLLPMTVRIGDDEYSDGINLNPTSFFEKLIATDELPKTSQITPHQFAECFEKLTADGSEVVAIVLSSKLSGTYNSALTAAEDFGGKVHVVDSLSATFGERGLLEYGLRLRDEGKSGAEIASMLTEARDRVRIIALLDTLEYLKRGGRISATVAAIGSTLRIKPIITVEGGEVKVVGKAIGAKKGNSMLVQHIRESEGVDFSMPHSAIYSGLSDETLRKHIADAEDMWKDHVKEVPVNPIGATIGTHIGPGAVGIVFFANKK